MSLLGSLAGAATSLIDQFVGGQLMKAELSVDKEDDRAGELAGLVFKFQFNPETIQLSRFAPETPVQTVGTENMAGRTGTAPTASREATINLGNIVLDTYEQKPNKSVYKEYIEVLERFAGHDKEKHAPAFLVFTWGKFSEERPEHLKLKCKIDKMDVQYTMFLNDGTPVRAKVTLTLKTGLPPKEQEQVHEFKSPDHAKLVTVKRGQTLADIAYTEYDNAAEWRRIADANGIDDPMSLRPGMKLVVPPILS